MNKKLTNKRAIVTGGSRGICTAIFRRLVRDGTPDVSTDIRSADRANETVKATQAFSVRTIAIQANNTNADAVVGAIDHTPFCYGAAYAKGFYYYFTLLLDINLSYYLNI